MEHAFAVARSKEKTCGICMEVVMDKSKGEARYPIYKRKAHRFPNAQFETFRKINSGSASCPTATTASACLACASGARPSSSSTRSSGPAQSAGRPRTSSSPRASGWTPGRRRTGCWRTTGWPSPRRSASTFSAGTGSAPSGTSASTSTSARRAGR